MRLDVAIPQTFIRRAQTATRNAGRGFPHMSHHSCATTGLYSSIHPLENEFRPIVGHLSSGVFTATTLAFSHLQIGPVMPSSLLLTFLSAQMLSRLVPRCLDLCRLRAEHKYSSHHLTLVAHQRVHSISLVEPMCNCRPFTRFVRPAFFYFSNCLVCARPANGNGRREALLA
jgi:hypothetical protein